MNKQGIRNLVVVIIQTPISGLRIPIRHASIRYTGFRWPGEYLSEPRGQHNQELLNMLPRVCDGSDPCENLGERSVQLCSFHSSIDDELSWMRTIFIPAHRHTPPPRTPHKYIPMNTNNPPHHPTPPIPHGFQMAPIVALPSEGMQNHSVPGGVEARRTILIS